MNIKAKRLALTAVAGKPGCSRGTPDMANAQQAILDLYKLRNDKVAATMECVTI